MSGQLYGKDKAMVELSNANTQLVERCQVMARNAEDDRKEIAWLREEVRRLNKLLSSVAIPLPEMLRDQAH